MQLSMLTAEQEHTLRQRLRMWSRNTLHIADEDFDDLYQGGCRKVLEIERKGRPTRYLEHALRWNLQNQWLEELRRRRRHPAASLESLPGPDRDLLVDRREDANPAQSIERLQAATSVLRAVGELTGRQQQIVLFADLWDRRPAEICTELEISQRTYRREHAHALAKITARVRALLEAA